MATRAPGREDVASDGGAADEQAAPATEQGAVWLDDDQQLAWRRYLDGTTRFVDALGRFHEQELPLSLSEYELLVRLSESPGRTSRMSTLADGLALSRSRLTHTVTRMEARGLVERLAVAGDRRGVNCVMTDAGFAALEAAAPGHVGAVRRLLVDALDADELQALGVAMAKVAAVSRADRTGRTSRRAAAAREQAPAT